MSMNNAYLNFRYKPFKFYLITFLVTCAALFLAAYFSYNENYAFYKYLFIFIGVLTPFTVAMFMIYGSGNDELKKDFINRLLNLKLIKPKYLLFILLIMPVTVVLATAISLLFGQPVGQFGISPGFSMTGPAAVTGWIVVILAPTFEELGWRGYGVDSLAKKGRSLFASTMIFAVLWDMWHWPLFAVNGYYHYEILQANIIYALNFVVSIFPVAFLHNWIYYKSNRSIPAIILFHAMNNLSMSLLQTEQSTKCITTAILLAVSVIVLLKDKSLWLDKATNTLIN
ncbi:MAG: CPBP family intramembrane metalloprotease [Chloroflexi bacterium]|nr:CPBP family intramembrane metalloprotease [Chloroflexota bacterium]